MTRQEGIAKIEDLIDEFAKDTGDNNDQFVDFLEEMIDRAETARDARLEELQG